MPEVDDAGRFEVVARLAPRPVLARVARSVAASYGSLHGLSIDEIDDVSLLVDEVFHALTVVAAGPITIRMTADDSLRLRIDAPPNGSSPGWEGLPTLHAVAGVVADEHRFDATGTQLSFVGQLGRTRRP